MSQRWFSAHLKAKRLRARRAGAMALLSSAYNANNISWAVIRSVKLRRRSA